jgi:hypothetical protein
MDYVKKKCIIDNLKKYSHQSNENEFIEVSEWVNGEGYDININDTKRISLSFDEFEAVKHLISCLINETDKFK